MKKQPEPLAELLWQEFPNTDPIELDKILKRVKQWLEQKQQYYERLSKQIARKYGQKATETYVSKAYPNCIEALLDEIITATWKHDT